jgi:NAD(P)H-flavin reductase/hemoglobin-like flavoprotein
VSALSLLLKESWSHVEDRSDELANHFYARLFLAEPRLRDLFPVNMSAQRSRLLETLVTVILTVDDPEQFDHLMRDLGRSHHKYHVEPEHYGPFGAALLVALRRFSGDRWSVEYDQAWRDAYQLVATAMQRGADEVAGHPAFWHAEVVSHERRSADLAVFACQPLIEYPYRAGQYATVETTHVPREWRPLSIANPPGTGPLEFHVRATGGGWVSSALVRRLRVGDVVRLGPARGSMVLDEQSTRDVVGIAGGTGLAPIKALVGELARANWCRWAHVFFGVRTRADFYDLPALNRLAAKYPWLSVIPACSDEPTYSGEQGNISEVMERLGPYPDHDFFVCGTPAMVRATLDALNRMHVPRSRIRYDAVGAAPRDG